MTSDDKSRVTELVTVLDGTSTTDETTATTSRLMECLYPNLKRLANKYLADERAEHTLQPTALVHEAYLKLVDQDRIGWQGRTHFFAVGARIMRQILIDHARTRARIKRGGDRQRVSLSEGRRDSDPRGLDMEQLLALNSALEELAALDPRQSKILELKLFAGLKVNEVATALGVSKRTVEGDWAHARLWLQRRLEPQKSR